MLSLAFHHSDGEVVLEVATSRWGCPSQDTLDGIAQELRSLGASLRLVNRDGSLDFVSLLTPAGAESFRILSSASHMPTSLLEALQIAGQSAHLQEGPRARHCRREVVFYSLVGALSLIFGDSNGDAPNPSQAPRLALA